MALKIKIYTDGAARGNPGPGGYGTVLLAGKHRKELSGGFRLTTNNRMELLAVIKGLEELKYQNSNVEIYSDSKYVVDAVEKAWLFSWEKKGFKNKKNPDLWKRFLLVYRKHNVSFTWIKGHANIPENERCDYLIRMKKKTTLIIYIYLLFFSHFSFSQNLFDEENSKKYAEHLYNSGEYNSAAKEFEHLTILSPENFVYKKMLIFSYQKNGEVKKAIQRIETDFGTSFSSYNRELINSYLKLLILNEEYKKCREILKKYLNLSNQERQDYALAISLLGNKTNKIEELINTGFNTGKQSNKFSELSILYNNQKLIKYKKPLTASVLSVVIPGLGKIYAKDFKIYGWGFGALATGFYIGNIFGSGKSAERENNHNNKQLKEKILQIIIQE